MNNLFLEFSEDNIGYKKGEEIANKLNSEVMQKAGLLYTGHRNVWRIKEKIIRDFG